MINVLIFFTLAMVIAAQVFFLSSNSADTMIVHSNMMQKRFAYEKYLYDAINAISTKGSGTATYSNFNSNRKGPSVTTSGLKANWVIYDLNYTLTSTTAPTFYNSWENYTRYKNSGKYYYQFVFPPMGPGYYLIRIYDPSTSTTDSRLMYQVLVHKSGDNDPVIKSFQEVWY